MHKQFRIESAAAAVENIEKEGIEIYKIKNIH